MIAIIRAIAVPATLLFGALLYLTSQQPEMVERAAHGFLKGQVQAKIIERFPELDPTLPKQGLQKLSTQVSIAERELTKRIQNGLPDHIATVIGNMCMCGDGNLDTEAHARVSKFARTVLTSYLEKFGIAREQLTKIIKGDYSTILASLRADVTIFLAINFIAFAAIFVATFARTRNRPLLILPTVIMLATVGISSSIYLFETNWFFAILFQDYWGYGYSLLVAGVFGLLLDVVMNRARITNLVFSVLSSALRPVC